MLLEPDTLIPLLIGFVIVAVGIFLWRDRDSGARPPDHNSCAACGAMHPVHAKFCPRCGKSV